VSKSQDLRIKKAVSLIASQLGANFEDLLRHLHSLEPEVVPRALHESQTGEDIYVSQTDMSPLEMVLLSATPQVAITFALPGCRVWKYEFRWTGPSGGHGVLIGESIDLEGFDDYGSTSADEVLKAIAKQRTKQLRKASFCKYCGELVMPDRRDEKYCCMSCSENILGVVH